MNWLMEQLFNSALVFFVTIPFLTFIFSCILHLFIKKKLKVLSVVFVVQVLLYYAYSCLICHMRIVDIYLDYVLTISIYTIVFGFLGTVFTNAIFFLIKSIKEYFDF